jgi:hypothetical protein
LLLDADDHERHQDALEQDLPVLLSALGVVPLPGGGRPYDPPAPGTEQSR